MSVLFSPIKLGALEIKNRFVHAATHEAMARETGEVTEELIKRYTYLARGGVGLIITGYVYIHPLGRARKFQTGIHNDEMIPGLKKMTSAVHNEGGRIALELSHAGRQTMKDIIGHAPLAPSRTKRDPIYFVKPKEMTEEDIQGVIKAFGDAAGRAIEAGTDVIHLHASGGYLINEFLSPFFNHRKDKWGGSDENRFRFLKQVIENVKSKVPGGVPIIVKMNVNDYTPNEGITPLRADKYAEWLVESGVDGVEISEGTMAYSFMNGWLGEVPIKELLKGFPIWMKPMAWMKLNKMAKKCAFREAWLLEPARRMKSILRGVPLILEGGLRRIEQMEMIVKNGDAQFIAMSRPFIREPYLVKHIKEGKVGAASCVSCNKCIGAVVNDLPVRCYNKDRN